MKHDDQAEDIALIKSMTMKTDPSVKVTDLYLSGEPRGCVPMDVTLGKPAAYYPAKPGPK